ncbi:MAG TPA: 30S ribosomal protein S20, partial [Verrucomicrobiae bacterium]
MPNTKSAERRMRGNERKHQHNRSVKSHLRHLEKNYRDLLAGGKKPEAAKLLPDLHSAFDKAVKS